MNANEHEYWAQSIHRASDSDMCHKTPLRPPGECRILFKPLSLASIHVHSRFNCSLQG